MHLPIHRRAGISLGLRWVGVVVGLAAMGCKEPSLGRDLSGGTKIDQGSILTAISGYRDWRKLNDKRFTAKNSAAELCGPAKNLHPGKGGPNGLSYMNVFVSDRGIIPLEALQAGSRTQTFPSGTVFVKERYSSPDQDVPDLLTVMIKRGFEYNSDASNWEFSVISGDGAKVLEYGRLSNCAACHAQAKPHDYVVGGYH